MEITKAFSTMDLYLAAFLSLNNVEPAIEVKGGKVIFTFDATDEVYKVMNFYNFNQGVPVADFVTRIKTLRGKMLTAKESIHGNGKREKHGYKRS